MTWILGELDVCMCVYTHKYAWSTICHINIDLQLANNCITKGLKLEEKKV